MKSDIIKIDNQGNGFDEAINETKKVGAYTSLDTNQCLRLQLCAEEMLSLARSVTGEMQASFWLENEGQRFELHMTTRTVMDKEKRSQLISSSSSRKNEAAHSLLGKLRDAFDAARAADVDHSRDNYIPESLTGDVFYHPAEDPMWDGYERSVLRKVADDIKIAIRGGLVDMTVSKSF